MVYAFDHDHVLELSNKWSRTFVTICFFLFISTSKYGLTLNKIQFNIEITINVMVVAESKV